MSENNEPTPDQSAIAEPGHEPLPVFPTNAPAVFCDADTTASLFVEVLDRLAAVIDADDSVVSAPTACAGFNVRQLQNHVLGWLQFFAAALTDPASASDRPDPDLFELEAGSSEQASSIVRACSARIVEAIAADVASELVTMSSSRMAGDGVLAMALGEYMVHAWDLAVATGQRYEAPAEAVGPAHEFLLGMVAPEYRGPDSGFFDFEVPVDADASPFDKFLGFAGRDPNWTASA